MSSESDLNSRSISSGTEADVANLLDKFMALGSVRYADFAKVWRDCNFSFIFWGRKQFAECLEFTEDLFQIAVEYTQPPNVFQCCIGAIYLLYGLYNKQLLDPKVRIRVTLTQWRQLQDLLCLAVQQEHHDFIYIFRWLEFNYAFDFVAQSSQMGPWPSHSRNIPRSNEAESAILEQKLKIKNFIEEGHVDILSSIHKKYEDVKKSLFENGSLGKSHEECMNVASHDVTKIVRTKLLELVGEECDAEDQDSSGKETVKESIADRRKRLKASQFSSKVESLRSAKHFEDT